MSSCGGTTSPDHRSTNPHVIIYFQATTTVETAPTPEKLIDNQIPTVVTEVPSIEVPTKFENLLDDPTIVFKSASGTQNRISSKVIKRLREKQTEMDRAREMLRNRLSSTTTIGTTTQTPFITVNDNRPKRPRPFSRLKANQPNSKNIKFPPTTISTLIQASTTTPLAGTTLSVRDKMVAARNRLRVLMGHKPIGMTTTRRPNPTTITPSAPTTMEKKRQKIIKKLEEEKEYQEALNTTDINPEKANIDIEDPSVITVTAKSTNGEVQNEINPLVLISPTFAPGSPELANLIVTEAPFSSTTPINDDTTIRIPDDVLDVPTRMQDTLMRLMKKKGLKKDPFAKLVTTAVTLVDTDEDFNEFTPPTPHQDPLLSKNLSPESKQNFDGLSTPRPHQSNLLRSLKANDDGIIEGLSTPSARQNYLLNQLKANDDGIVEGLSTPSSRQNYLLKQLKANDDGIVEGLTTPSARQNYLLRQLQKGHNEDLQLNLPNRKQNPLLRQLKKAHNEKISGLREPSRKQNPFLKSLVKGDSGEAEGLELPRNPLADPLFRSERPFNRFNPDGLNLPNKRQNPLLRILRFDRRERILTKGLTPPRYKQNPLFRQLVQTPQRYRNDFLQLPPRQQNKLLSILNRHGGDNFNADGLLTVPRFKEELELVEETPEEYYDEEQESFDDEVYEDYEEEEDFFDGDVSTTATPARLVTTARPPDRLRPIMPRSKFEILQIKKPVEEVTFKRVSEPLDSEQKREGRLFLGF